MVVVGAAFAADAAGHAARALARLPYVAPDAIARAPLGAVGRAAEGKVLVAVRVAEAAIEEVARIVDQLGGEIVTRHRYPETNDHEPAADVNRHGPVDLSTTAVPGRTDN